MNLFQKISLLRKISKAWKESKKLIDSKQGLADDVKKIIGNLQADLEALVILLPAFSNVLEEEKKIIANVFKKKKDNNSNDAN